MTAEAHELRARKLLAVHEKTVLDEIERRKGYAAYGLCIDDTKSALRNSFSPTERRFRSLA